MSAHVDPGTEAYAESRDHAAHVARLSIHGGLCCCGKVRVYTDGSAPGGHGRDACERGKRGAR